jgi:hypothetical protein
MSWILFWQILILMTLVGLFGLAWIQERNKR